MAEYIERETLIEKLNEAPAYFDSGDIRYGIDIATSIVIKQPTADVVEVVRCKDCKYLYCLSAIDRRFYCKHHPQGLSGINIVEDNPFCSYGERSEDNA